MENMMYTVNGREFELQHYGVKGMKWGVRKAQKEYAELDRRKAAYKQAKKAYNKSFSKAYNRNAGLSPFKKQREASAKRWADAYDKADKMNAAKQAYKDQKKAVRKNTTIGQKIGRGARHVPAILGTVGYIYAMDQTFYGGQGSKAAKAAVKGVVNKVGDQMFDYAILDKAGKVIRRYN